MSVALATIGHNGAPEPTPFEAVKVHIEDLWSEACNWVDGAEIESQEQADAVARLIEDFRLAHVAADNARKDENKPFDDGKAEVQTRYAPLIADTKGQTGKTVKAMAALKNALTPWLKKLDAEKRVREEETRLEAERAAKAAADAARAANLDSLADQEAVEIKVAEAHIAASAAKAAVNDRAHAKGDGRAIGLRKFWVAVLTDQRAAILHYMKDRPDTFLSLVQQLAEQDVREGKRSIPGFDVNEEARV